MEIVISNGRGDCDPYKRKDNGLKQTEREIAPLKPPLEPTGCADWSSEQRYPIQNLLGSDV